MCATWGRTWAVRHDSRSCETRFGESAGFRSVPPHRTIVGEGLRSQCGAGWNMAVDSIAESQRRDPRHCGRGVWSENSLPTLWPSSWHLQLSVPPLFFQYALSTRAGTECIAHVVQALTDADPFSTMLGSAHSIRCPGKPCWRACARWRGEILRCHPCCSFMVYHRRASGKTILVLCTR